MEEEEEWMFGNEDALAVPIHVYRIAGYFRGMYISRIATSILVHEN